MLFGLGFDTATEVALLALAGTGAAAGLPWYAVLTLPVLFAAGMTMMDTADGMFMTVAYDWAFAKPVRKVYYNLTVTGLSVAVAVLIGTIELVGVLHDELGLTDPFSEWIGSVNLNNFGFVIVAMFVITWTIAIAYWRLGGVENRWHNPAPPHPANQNFALLDEVAQRNQTWPVMAAKYGVDNPLPPWKTSLDGLCDVLDRSWAIDEQFNFTSKERRDEDDAIAATRSANLPYPENQLVSLSHSLLVRGVIDEGALRQRLTTVRARLEA